MQQPVNYDAVDVSETAAGYEERLIRLDGERLHGAAVQTAELDALYEELAAASAAAENQEMQAHLAALQGRAALLDGNTPRARRLYETAASLAPDEVQTLILGLRLEDDAAVRLSRIEEMLPSAGDNAAFLLLEQAVANYQLKAYSVSAAQFDAAFLVLGGRYRSAYGSVRDTAWNLRLSSSAASGDTDASEYLTAAALDADGVLLITQAETSLLEFITGGKLLSAAELRREAAEQKLLPAAAIAEPLPVTRGICAQYIWNLYARRRRIDTDYAALYAEMRITESPIPDVALDSPIFTAVAGCIENELMSLPDGIHFMPDGTVSGAEFLYWIRQADR